MEPLHTAAAHGDLPTLNLLLTTKLRDADPSAAHPTLKKRPSFLHRLFHPQSKPSKSGSSVAIEEDSGSLPASFSELTVGSVTTTETASSTHAIPSEVKEYVNASNRFGMTALHAACFHGQLGAMQLLLHFGADPNQQSRTALQPLSGSDLLSEIAVNESSTSVNWTFALHVAAFRGHHKIVKELLKRGADPYLLDFRGLTAAEVAEGAKHLRTARIIREYVSERSKKGYGAEETVMLRYSKGSGMTNDSADKSAVGKQMAKPNKSESSLLAASPPISLYGQDEYASAKASSSQIDLHPIAPAKCPIVLPSGPWDRDDIYLDASSRGRDKLHQSSTEDFFLD